MSKTKLISIDASSKKTGLAYFENAELIDYKLLDYSSISDREKRMENMCKAILQELDERVPDILIIEDSWNAANVEVTKLLTRIMGVTYGWCLQHKCEWNSVLPSRWRKLCNIEQGKKKRNELKQASIEYVFNEYGITVGDDVADAIAIGRGHINYFSSLSLFE